MKKSQHIPDQQLDNLLDLLSGEQPVTPSPQGLSENERALYEELVRIKAAVAELGGWEEVDTTAALKEFKARTGLSAPAGRVLQLRRILWFAAAIMLPIVIGITGWWYFTRGSNPARQLATNTPALSNESQVRLMFNDGRIINVSSQEQITGTDGTILIRDSADTWHYQPDNKNSTENAFNTLEIPESKTFHLTLADGTKISLNAGSKLQYPTTFVHGTSRKVTLSGEACFNVVSDAAQPFTVETGKQTITVLGTFFNVNTYGQQISTTVANGRVLVSLKSDSAHLLGQGEQSVYNEATGEMNIMKCDPSYAFAWKDGRMAFNNAAFREVMEQLSHTYNYQVHITTTRYDHLHFNVPPIARPEDISTMLDLIKNSTSMNIHFKANPRKRTVEITD